MEEDTILEISLNNYYVQLFLQILLLLQNHERQAKISVQS